MAAMFGIRNIEANEVPEKIVLCTGGLFRGCNSPVVAHKTPRTTKGRSPVAEQLLGTS